MGLRLQIFGSIGYAAVAELFEPFEFAAVDKCDPDVLRISPYERALIPMNEALLEGVEEPVQRELGLGIGAVGSAEGKRLRGEVQCRRCELCGVFFVELKIIFGRVFGDCLRYGGDIVRLSHIVLHEVCAVFIGRIGLGLRERLNRLWNFGHGLRGESRRQSSWQCGS